MPQKRLRDALGGLAMLRCRRLGALHDAQRSADARSGQHGAGHHVPPAQSPAGGRAASPAGRFREGAGYSSRPELESWETMAGFMGFFGFFFEKKYLVRLSHFFGGR